MNKIKILLLTLDERGRPRNEVGLRYLQSHAGRGTLVRQDRTRDDNLCMCKGKLNTLYFHKSATKGHLQ